MELGSTNDSFGAHQLPPPLVGLRLMRSTRRPERTRPRPIVELERHPRPSGRGLIPDLEDDHGSVSGPGV